MIDWSLWSSSNEVRTKRLRSLKRHHNDINKLKKHCMRVERGYEETLYLSIPSYSSLEYELLFFMFQVIIMSFICMHIHERVLRSWVWEVIWDAWFLKSCMSLCISFIHDGLLVLICSLYDEFILHLRTNVPKGESIVKPRKVPISKTPLSTLFYRGRIVISSFTHLPEVV